MLGIYCLIICFFSFPFPRDVILDNSMDFTEIIKFFNGESFGFIMVSHGLSL